MKSKHTITTCGIRQILLTLCKKKKKNSSKPKYIFYTEWSYVYIIRDCTVYYIDVSFLCRTALADNISMKIPLQTRLEIARTTCGRAGHWVCAKN